MPARLLPFLLVALVPLYGIMAADAYGQDLLIVAGLHAIAVIGYQLVFGRAGALSLAQGFFFGLGGYVTGILATQLPLGFAVTFPASILAAMALAWLIAAPVLRLESHYFALATLGIAQLGFLVAVNWEEVTGGANGIYGVPPIQFGGLEITSSEGMLLMVWLVAGLATAVFLLLTRGRHGARFETLRAAPLTAPLLGIDIGRMRLIAFLAGAAFAAAAGALQVHHLGVVSPAIASFEVMVAFLTMAVVGGRGSALGAILGALLLVHVPEWFRFLEDWYLLAYGVLLLAVIVLAPEGLVGLAARWRPGAVSVMATRDDTKEDTSAVFAAPPPLILGGVAKRYGGVTAVGGIDIEVAPGEIHGLIGPNGSGKTTALNLISGLDPVDAGEIRLGTRDLLGTRPHAIARLGIGRSLQHPEFPPNLTVRDIVRAATPITMADETADQAAARALAEMGLLELMEQRAAALTPEARRRLDIARALATGATILLLDEPAAGLSEEERADLASRLRALADRGFALLVVEHAMDFLLPIADRVTCLAEGRVIAHGTPAEVSRDPVAVAAYFGSGTP